MRFPTAKKIEDLAFSPRMQMATVPRATFKEEHWNANVGAKAKLQTAWFRISGLPMEKRTVRKVSYIASFVGLPLEVDTNNLKRWSYVRVKIGCRDITKVPAVAEGVLDMHFYDFVFQREVPQEGFTNAAGNIWTRNNDRASDDNPSPKKQKRDEHGTGEASGKEMKSGEGPSDHEADRGKKVAAQEGDLEPMDHDDDIGMQNIIDKGKQNMNMTTHNTQEKFFGMGDKMDGEDDDSEDQGLCFDDIISPGGEHLNFGTFQNMEIKKLWAVRMPDNNSTIINE